MSAANFNSDCIVVGASFAGLACATALARAGYRVRVLEKKAEPGEKLHTTGIIVKDAIDQIALLDGMPSELARRIDGVRLYAPCMRSIDLAAPGYYFLATDTPALMCWLATRATDAGAIVQCRAPFTRAERIEGGFRLAGFGTTRFLIGADGPNSAVARTLGLGRNAEFLFGFEHEYAGATIPSPDRLHCFIDKKLAPGYIGWMLAGVGAVQVGLARRVSAQRTDIKGAMTAFLDKIAPLADFRVTPPSSVRAGMIPCGGVVRNAGARRVLLLGDAAGMVSPVTAGGIHTGLKHGLAAGHAIADFLAGRQDDPGNAFIATYPRYRAKRALRWCFDRFQSDLVFDLLLGTRLMRAAAGIVYFHHKGVFVDAESKGATRFSAEPARAPANE
jgi:digeranylgeranylglycerophospholipid reductase